MTPLDEAIGQALAGLWQDRGAIDAFNKLFLETKLYVPTKPKQGVGTGDREGGELHFWVYSLNGQIVMPVFDSVRRLREWIDDGAEIFTVQGTELVEKYCRDTLVAVNPYSANSKLLTRPDLRRLRAMAVEQSLDRSEDHRAVNLDFTADLKLSDDFIAATMTELRKRSQVRAAYLVELFDRPEKDQHHFMFVLDIEGNQRVPEKVIARELADAARRTLPKDSHVETALYHPEEGLGAAISDDRIPPFYTRDHDANTDTRDLR